MHCSKFRYSTAADVREAHRGEVRNSGVLSGSARRGVATRIFSRKYTHFFLGKPEQNQKTPHRSIMRAAFASAE